MIVIPGLLLICSMNYGVFLAVIHLVDVLERLLKPVPPLHFILRVMEKESAPITHMNRPYVHTFATNLHQYG